MPLGLLEPQPPLMKITRLKVLLTLEVKRTSFRDFQDTQKKMLRASWKLYRLLNIGLNGVTNKLWA
jgi:hypothetical protein